MSSLRVKQVRSKLLELFETHLDLTDLSPHDTERETKILSRCLAAFAVYSTTGCSEKEAALSVWDGQDDNGVDAAFVDASEKRVLLIQAKWINSGSGEPEAKDIAAFANGVKDIVEQEQTGFASRLHGKLIEINQALSTPGTTIEIILISTGASEIQRHGTANLDRVLRELNGDDTDELASKTVFGLAEIYKGLASDTSLDRINLDANILEWSSVSQPQQAYFGIIDGLQLKEWWVTHGKRLVAKNIRHALGATEVNTQIRQTAVSNPDYFWYFNNGITLIAEEALKAPKGAASRSSGLFQFKGSSIVNGAQTVSTLGRVENDESLGRVRVPIRVVLLRAAPENFGAEVTRTNNLQNRVEARDFVAQDSEQTRIQMEMKIEGIDYQVLRSEDFTSSPSSCELVEVTTALACASGDPAMAVQIKTGISRFFSDLKKPPYIALFNPSLSGAKAFNAVLMQREIDKWIDLKKGTLGKKSGFPWGVLVHGNRVLAAAVFKRLGPATLTQPIADFQANIPLLHIPTHCEDIYSKMLKFLETTYPGKFLAVLFKSPSMSKNVFDAST